MDTLIRSFGSPVFGPIYAFFAGVLTSASPCALAAIPLVIGHMAGSAGSTRKKDLASFLVGMALALTAVGVVAGALGRSLILTVPWLRPLAGLAFIILGAAYLDLFGGSKTCKVNLPIDAQAGATSGVNVRVNDPRYDGVNGGTNDGANDRVNDGTGNKTSTTGRVLAGFSLGALYGVSASPCATPALLAILSLVAVTGSLTRGAALLLVYSLGQSVLILVAGLATSRFKGFLENQRNALLLEAMRKLGGAIIMLFGLYILVRPFL